MKRPKAELEADGATVNAAAEVSGGEPAIEPPCKVGGSEAEEVSPGALVSSAAGSGAGSAEGDEEGSASAQRAPSGPSGPSGAAETDDEVAPATEEEEKEFDLLPGEECVVRTLLRSGQWRLATPQPQALFDATVTDKNQVCN